MQRGLQTTAFQRCSTKGASVLLAHESHVSVKLSRSFCGRVSTRPIFSRRCKGHQHSQFTLRAQRDGGWTQESGTDSLFGALKAAELSWTGRDPRDQTEQTASVSSRGVGPEDSNPGTTSLLEALRLTEQARKGVSQQASQGLRNGAGMAASPSSQSTTRAGIQVGSLVDIVLKKDQENGRLTRGSVAKILTNSANHPRGIKVRLKSGEVGRIHEVLALPSDRPPSAVVESTSVTSSSNTSVEKRGSDTLNNQEDGFSGRTAAEAKPSKGDADAEEKTNDQSVTLSTKIFLTGLPREATNDDLHAALEGIDGVVDSFVVLNKQKQCQGYGFVEVATDSVEEGIRRMNELEIRGQRLIAAISIEQKPKDTEKGSKESGESGQQKRPGKTRASEVRTDDGARLLLEAFQSFQNMKKASTRKKGRRGASPRVRAEGDSDSDFDEEAEPSGRTNDDEMSSEEESASGEPRVITISDITHKDVDPDQPSMGQLVMAAMERAREKKGMTIGQDAGSVAKVLKSTSRRDFDSDDEQEYLPLQPLKIDPTWTARIEALLSKLEEIKRLPVEV